MVHEADQTANKAVISSELPLYLFLPQGQESPVWSFTGCCLNGKYYRYLKHCLHTTRFSSSFAFYPYYCSAIFSSTF